MSRAFIAPRPWFLVAYLVVVTAELPASEPARAPQSYKQETKVSSIDFYGTDLKFAWTFTNDLPKPIKLLTYVWELHVDGEKIQRGQSRQQRKLDPGAGIDLEFPLTIKHATLEKILKTNSLPSRLPYEFIGRATLGANVRTWGFDLTDKGEVNVLKGPDVTIQRFSVSRMDEERAAVAIEITIRNPNNFPSQLSNFTADLILAGQTVAQEVQGPSREIPANGTALVPLELDLNFKRLGRVVYNALSQKESEFTLYGKTEVSTPWGTKRLNYDHSGKVTIERDSSPHAAAP